MEDWIPHALKCLTAHSPIVPAAVQPALTMPRAIIDLKPPRKSPKSGKKPPSPPLRFRCPKDTCAWSYPRQSDLTRHSLTHMTPEEQEEHMFVCSYPGCSHRTLQRSNMNTHFRIHTGEKPQLCPDCVYSTGDPASLTQHRKKMHDYIPGEDAPRARKRARVAAPSFDYPYPPSSDSSSSPGSTYSELSLQSRASSSSVDSFPSSPDYPVAYAAPPPAHANDFASSYDYSEEPWAFETACAMDLLNVGFTPRPGPPTLSAAANTAVLQPPMEGVPMSYDELARMLTHAGDSPLEAEYLEYRTLPHSHALSRLRLGLSLTSAHLVPQGARFLSTLEESAVLARDRDPLFSSEWLGVASP
ncbi:hypothetical protein FB451DRAFT_1452907 [Mycena latifolia]|nr:hypothetical protein FB451DRAFT_1452907 [Mycena latifolia]